MKGRVFRRGITWSFVVDGPRKEGKRNQINKNGFPTRKAAEQALAAFNHRSNQGGFVQPTRQTFGQFIEEWLPAIKSRVRASTWTSYSGNLKKHVSPRLGHIPLQKITPSMLNTLYAELLAEKLSKRTVQLVHIVIHHALKDAVRWDRLDRNVAESADAPKVSRKQMRVWSAEELGRFLHEARPTRLYAAFLLMATTGMRRGEALGLRWRDVDLSQGRVSISQTIISVAYEVIFSEPKTAKGRRSVALDDATVAALRAHRKTQMEEHLAFSLPRPEGDALVFIREDGTLVHPESLSKLFNRIVKAAKFPRIRLHDLRHTYATLSLQAEIPAKVVSERLGHANIAITLDTYSHVIPGMQEDAAKKVAALIPGLE